MGPEDQTYRGSGRGIISLLGGLFLSASLSAQAQFLGSDHPLRCDCRITVQEIVPEDDGGIWRGITTLAGKNVDEISIDENEWEKCVNRAIVLSEQGPLYNYVDWQLRCGAHKLRLKSGKVDRLSKIQELEPNNTGFYKDLDWRGRKEEDHFVYDYYFVNFESAGLIPKETDNWSWNTLEKLKDKLGDQFKIWRGITHRDSDLSCFETPVRKILHTSHVKKQDHQYSHIAVRFHLNVNGITELRESLLRLRDKSATATRTKDGVWEWENPNSEEVYSVHRIINGVDSSRPIGMIFEYSEKVGQEVYSIKDHFFVPRY